MARELESAPLDLLILCPSSAAQKNRGKYILRPGPMTFAEEKLLEFLGQVSSAFMNYSYSLIVHFQAIKSLKGYNY